MSERQPLLDAEAGVEHSEGKFQTHRKRCAEYIESPAFHKTVITLVRFTLNLPAHIDLY